ncbi:group 10 secretory phospholipase A2 [Cricetulus griseus]|uniref:Phospholipase A2 n=1 Tax=Cricetulus griseus TaxID=10029 RepID=A0A8C2LLB0_CRIGR|nr:group 10 secretory phospholipase A2 [Cricetulus griseus]XP_027280550.1 group 10 secretory phospholipase A2 [Cricetulus griseus]
MLLLLLLLLLLGPGPGLSEATRRLHVFKRGLLELAGTVDCVGPRSPMAYMNYGCHCGLGGRGKPRDAIDWCCHHHDCCYAKAQDAGCSPKIDRYPWRCINNHIQCGPAENKCQELLCKCDKELAYCLKGTEYHLKYLFYPSILCKTMSPTCA